MEKDQLKYISITRKWGGKKIRREYDTKIDKWISQFDEKEKDIIIELLKHFNYYTSRKLSTRVIRLYQLFIEKYVEDPEKIVFIPVYKEYGVGFSDEFFNQFWISNNLKDSAEKNIHELLKEGNTFDKIVIVDDYSGSGKTIKRTIQKCIDTSADCKQTVFYVLVIQMSVSAIKEIEKYAEDQGIEIRVVTLQTQEKAFENESIFSQDVFEETKEEYSKICRTRNIHEDYIFGYEKTQALVSFTYNTPNNTLGVFWYEDEHFFAIFKRHKTKDTTLLMMQKDTKRRKRERSKDIIKSHNEDEKYIYLMAYLVNVNLDFNYIEACKKFGMTEEQMDEAIVYLIENNYISIKSGRFSPTNKLKQLITISRISDLKAVDSINDDVNFSEKDYIPRDIKKIFTGY